MIFEPFHAILKGGSDVNRSKWKGERLQVASFMERRFDLLKAEEIIVFLWARGLHFSYIHRLS